MTKLLAVCICLLALSRPAIASNPQWMEVRSPHFVVLTDDNEKECRKLAGQFERMRALFRTILPHAGGDAGLPITVLAFKDKKGFQSVEPGAYLSKGQLQLAGLFLNTRDRNYILLRLDAESEQQFATVYHEYTHFILRKVESLPLWLNEGLAEFYQNTDITDKDVILGKPSGNDILYLRENRLIPLTTLFAVDHNSPYYHDEQKGSVFYSESWALTHFLEIEDFKNKTHRIQDYATLVFHHEDPVAAAQKAFGDLGKLQKALDAYVSNGNYKEFHYAIGFTADPASFQARAVTQTDVDAVRANVLANNGRKADAKALAESILKADPKNGLAHETMGALAFQDNDREEARKWYGEAVQLDSQSCLAHYYYAVLSMSGGSGPEKDGLVEGSLRQAIKLEPSFAPAYEALANFYAMRDKDLEEAYHLLLQAVQMEPSQLSYRINASQVLVQQKKFASALSVLNAAMEITTDRTEAAQVQTRISQVNEYQQSYERYEAMRANGGHEIPSGTTTVEVTNTRPVENERVYPTPEANAKHGIAHGVIHNVKCTYPSVLTFSVEDAGKRTDVFSPNYFKIPFTTLNFQPKGDLDPCKMMDGMKASVPYVAVNDKEFAGQIDSIQLSR